MGLEAFLVDPTALARQLQKAFATSTSVDALPGKNVTASAVVVAGALAKKLAAYLAAELGIPTSSIVVKPSK